MISLLCPTRGRPEMFARMVSSAVNLAFIAKNLEIIAYLDNNDKTAGQYPVGFVRYIIGPRITLSDTWNKCAEISNGDILNQCNDDVVFRTSGWDQMVEEAFASCPDKILMVHGDALAGNRETFGPHPFVSRRWVDIVGYITPPHYSSDFGDTHLNDVANMLGRRKFLPFVMEHMHPVWGKAEWDRTHQERIARHDQDRPQDLYLKMFPERQRDASKLKEAMDPAWKL